MLVSDFRHQPISVHLVCATVAVYYSDSQRSVSYRYVATVRNERKRRVITPLSEYERVKRPQRQALSVEDLSDAEIDAISRVEPPAEAAQHNHELTEGQSAADRREARSE